MIAILWVKHGIMCGIKGRGFVVLFRWKLNHFGLRKCLHGQELTNKEYLSNITVKTICQRFTYKTTAENGWHRHETKLRHCHAMYRVSDGFLRCLYVHAL